MSSKNISIKESVYERLSAHKRTNESFSDVIERLLENEEPDWRNSAGIYSDEEAREIEEYLARKRVERAGDHERKMNELFGQ